MKSIVLLVTAVSMTVASHAAVTLVGNYNMDAIGASNPYLTDSATADGTQNFANRQGSGAVWSVTTGIAAGSTGAIKKTTTGSAGFFNGGSYGSLTNNYGIDFYYQASGSIRNGTLLATINSSSSDLNFQINGGNYQIEGAGSTITSGIAAVLNTTVRLSVIRDSGLTHFYVDGSEVGTASATATGTLDQLMLGFGAGGLQDTIGIWDELKVYTFDDADSLSSIESAMAIPEPGSAALLGLAGLALMLRRRR